MPQQLSCRQKKAPVNNKIGVDFFYTQGELYSYTCIYPLLFASPTKNLKPPQRGGCGAKNSTKTDIFCKHFAKRMGSHDSLNSQVIWANYIYFWPAVKQVKKSSLLFSFSLGGLVFYYGRVILG